MSLQRLGSEPPYVGSYEHRMHLEVQVDTALPSQWSQWLDRFEDANIYQTWSYGAVRWGEKNLSHLVIKRDGEPVAMAQLRILRPGKFRCGIAYLRWGPLCHLRGRELDAAVVEAMASALRQEYVEKRGLFLRILPNAFVGSARAAIFEAAFSNYSREDFHVGESYRTFSLDLDPPIDVLRKQLDQKWRNCLNRAEKNGLTVAEGTGPDEFREFLRIYEEMWARKQFEKGSDVHEFERIQRDLPAAHRMKVLLCMDKGIPTAGMVATAMGDSAIYLLGATSDAGMKLKGSYLLHWQLITRLKALGVRSYNLGGINPEKNPGVYHFKAGFSGQDVLYMPPLVACDNLLSKGFAQAGRLARGRLRNSLNRVLRSQS